MLSGRVLLPALFSLLHLADGEQCPTSGTCIFEVNDADGATHVFDFSDLTPEDEGYGCEGHKISDDVHNYIYYVGVCGNNAKECGYDNPASVTQYYDSGGWSFCEGVLGVWAEKDIVTEILEEKDDNGQIEKQGLRLTFLNGEACWTVDGDKPRTTILDFVCDPDAVPMGDPTGGESDDEDCTYNFQIPTARACPGGGGGGGDLSLGSLLLILGFFVCLPVYCVGGFLWNKYKLEKEGMAESIPHLDFWKRDLWSYVTAGFTVTKEFLCGLCGNKSSRESRASSADE